MKRQLAFLAGGLGLAAMACTQTNALAQAGTANGARPITHAATPTRPIVAVPPRTITHAPIAPIPSAPVSSAGTGNSGAGILNSVLKPLPQPLQTHQVAAPSWTGTEPAVMEERRMMVPQRVPLASLRSLSTKAGGIQQAWQVVPNTTYYWQRGGGSFAATELVQGNPANPSARGIRVWSNNGSAWSYRDTSFDNWGVLLPSVAPAQNNVQQLRGLFDVFGDLFSWAKSIGSWIKDHWPQLQAIWKDLKAILKDAKALIADVLKLSENKNDQTGANATKAIHDTGQQGAQQKWLLSRRVAVGMYRVQGVTPEAVDATTQFVGGR